MNKKNFVGFKSVPREKQKNITAGFSAAGIINGATSLVNIADNISNTIIKNKIVNKMDEVSKGEIELGKNGEIRLKWDSITPNNLISSKIIF